MFWSDVSIVNDDLWMLDAHAHVMQVKLCKANTRGVTSIKIMPDNWTTSGKAKFSFLAS